MNFKKHDIISTEKNYNVHIFMQPTEENGSQGFSIKKRKNLSEEERREIEMEVTTGKVNQLDIEKSYFENFVPEENSENNHDDYVKPVGDNERSHNHHNHHHSNNRNNNNNNRRNDNNKRRNNNPNNPNNRRNDNRYKNSYSDEKKGKSFFSFLFKK